MVCDWSDTGNIRPSVSVLVFTPFFRTTRWYPSVASDETHSEVHENPVDNVYLIQADQSNGVLDCIFLLRKF